jgi:hypothetical protein
MFRLLQRLHRFIWGSFLQEPQVDRTSLTIEEEMKLLQEIWERVFPKEETHKCFNKPLSPEDHVLLAVWDVLQWNQSRFCPPESLKGHCKLLIRDLRRHPTAQKVVEQIDWHGVKAEDWTLKLLDFIPQKKTEIFAQQLLYEMTITNVREYFLEIKFSFSRLDESQFIGYSHGDDILCANINGIFKKYIKNEYTGYWESAELFAEFELLQKLKEILRNPHSLRQEPDRIAALFLGIPQYRTIAKAIEWDPVSADIPYSWDLEKEYPKDYYHREFLRAITLEIRKQILEPKPQTGDCTSCRFFSGSQHLKCAVNPGRLMDENCLEWKEDVRK